VMMFASSVLPRMSPTTAADETSHALLGEACIVQHAASLRNLQASSPSWPLLHHLQLCTLHAVTLRAV
jgi:hypothetical protein